MCMRSALVVGIAVAGMLALASTAGAATDVNCGDTITTDTTLHHNLVNCPNNGIVIGADNITLDLNYHTVDGDGSLTPGCDFETEFCDEGVVNLGHDGVTVAHGSVRGFAFGADAGRVRHVRFLDISASKNLFFGMLMLASARSVIRNCSSIRNIPPEGDGIGLFASDHVRIVNNKIRRNAGPGIHLDDSNQNLIKGNRFSRNGPAILMAGDRNEIRRNRISRGGGILAGPASHNEIARNRVSRATESIRVEKGRSNLVTRNVVVRARGPGIRLGIQKPSVGGANNVVSRNQVKRSGDDGFLVNEKDNRSLLKGNVAIGAADDGFDVRSHSAKLTGNRALRNRDLGIAARRGVIDGGGNSASGNGDLRQCTNIVCS
jgi:parallel beta-helix repeat protein